MHMLSRVCLEISIIAEHPLILGASFFYGDDDETHDSEDMKHQVHSLCFEFHQHYYEGGHLQSKQT